MKTHNSTNIKQTKEILCYIEDKGGFCNYNNLNEKEIAEWVRHFFGCSYYVSKKVAKYL